MTWHQQNVKYNSLITQLFDEEDWKKRAEAARELGLMKDARAVNLLCRALRSEKDQMVIDRIIEALGRIGDARATLRIIEKLDEELDQYEGNKYRLIYILEALKLIKDKRSITHVAPFLNSPDEEIKSLTEKVFDAIIPNWKEIIEKAQERRSIKDIFSNLI